MIELSEITTYEIHRQLKKPYWALVLTPFGTLSVAQKAYVDEIKYNPNTIYRLVEIKTIKKVIDWK